VAVACAVGGVVVEVVAALGGGGGVSVDEERVWVRGEAVLVGDVWRFGCVFVWAFE
jgi:hypothetical protein